MTVCFDTAPTSITITFENGPAQLHELDVFTDGNVPESVQRWEHPKEGEVDLILFATHSDNDQLFFAGLLPYYGVERGYEVMVAYLTDHHNTAPARKHEVLNGLWAVGVRNYPVWGGFADFGDAETAEEAFQKFDQRGSSREEMTGFVVEQLRRYKPMVIVGHDFKGEYGHAQHRAYAQLLADAIEVSGDPEFAPESAQKYDVWDVPKTYIHLYKDNQIVMDWDQPMENFQGMTPFEVTRDLGFPVHRSQQKGWGWYFQGKKSAAQIETYSPCLYGLYHTTVGDDLEKNDMFENLNSHAELAHMAAEEELARLEAERLEKEAELEETNKLIETVPPVTETDTQTDPTEPDTLFTETAPTAPALENSTSSFSDTLLYWLCIEGFLVLSLIVILVIRRRKRAKSNL